METTNIILSIATSIILIAITIIGFFLKSTYSSINTRLDKLSDRIDRLNDRIDNLFSLYAEIPKTIRETLKDLTLSKPSNLIRTDNINFNTTNPSPYIESNSPIEPNEMGKTMWSEIKGEDLYNKYKENMKREVLSYTPKATNKFDLQSDCLSVSFNLLPKLLTDKEINRIKNYAYEKPIFNLNDIFQIFGLTLRNDILKEDSSSYENKI